MKATIIASVIGVLGFGEDGDIIEKALFPKSALKTAEKLLEIEKGRAVNEVTGLIEKLKEKGYSNFVFENPDLAQTVREKSGVEVGVETPTKIGEAFRGDMGRYAVLAGFVEEASELTAWVRDVSMEMSRTKVRRATGKRDLLIVQAIQALDDLDKTLNLFMSRVREWYGLHFPELDRLIDRHETYARLVSSLGKRENFTAEALEKEQLSKSKVLQLAKTAETSMGADFSDTDMKQIMGMCKHVLELYDGRSDLEQYINDIMEEVAPNTSALAGATLGARLIAMAGGLENLAKMPASTIQVLGAEKALFRSLTTGARPPKHGILFQHIAVHGAKRWLRGKIARAFAGKLAIAVRTDAFSGNDTSEKLKADLEKRIEEINEKYSEPKPRRPAKKSEKKSKGVSQASHKRRRKHGSRG
ncbi:MAG: C/D box methylation guide ribonucleoprotein complex aNOP56 subunit [Candidatus Bathyarchaeota archaeon]|nr:C/D box methylation guide ribonucleoprotein complex aNOP56 subunit [Candidatus Bathyarchaeota archaeon]